jgi:uncharacterized protein YyaL (SSP411 family)
MSRYGTAYGRMLSVLDRRLAEPVEIAIVGRRDDGATRELIQAAHGRFLRNGTITGRLDDGGTEGVPLLAGRDLVDGGAAAYVCRGYACKLPVTSARGVHSELEYGPTS